MSNKLKVRQKRAKRQRRKFGAVVVVTILTLLTTATMAGIWRNGAGVRHLRALVLSPPPPSIPPPSNPSKEYIYAGGKLVATEAPVTLVAPLNLVATTASNLTPAQVTITWQATTGADHYEVQRTTNVNAGYTSINANVVGTSLTDTTVTSNPVTAYLYRVRAVDANGNVSPYSNFDLATAISFTDDTLQTNATLVKAAHVMELRRAVDAVRAVTANLGPAAWGPDLVQYSTTIQATHINDLRNNLDPARSALGLPACNYTDVGLTALRASYIKKEHIEQLRNCLK